MRERIAIGVAVLTVAVLVTLSGVFARAQNPPVRETANVAAEPDLAAPSSPAMIPEGPDRAALAADSLRGRVVFDSAGCASCHSVSGAGNPRYPLDGVGSRRTAAELRSWSTGADALADSLPPSAWRSKQAFRNLKAADLDALITYLSSLKRR